MYLDVKYSNKNGLTFFRDFYGLGRYFLGSLTFHLTYKIRKLQIRFGETDASSGTITLRWIVVKPVMKAKVAETARDRT